ncbi:MAG TPA: hypothetical protein VFW46_07890 [Stellaceae bacterium]|nr:hypothetical protein [Stellaceae bacterium]
MSQPSALAVIADAIDQQLEADEQQLGLFSEPATEGGRAKFDAQRVRGAGRPPGARNKRTEATVAHLLARYRDPRAVALERIQMHPADLAAVLGCSIYEAEQEQRLLIAVVLPFIAARITPDVIDNRQVIHLTIGGASEGGPAAATIEYHPPAHDPDTIDLGQDAIAVLDQSLDDTTPAAAAAAALPPGDPSEDPS